MSGSYNSREYPNILTEEEKCQLQIVPDEDDGWISNDEEHYDDSIEGERHTSLININNNKLITMNCSCIHA